MANTYSIYKTTPYNDSAAPAAEGLTILAPSTAGVHALYDNTSAAFPGPFTNPTVPSRLSVTFTALWDGGDVTVTGTDVTGVVQSEVFADVAGTTVQGTKVFATVTGATKETPAGVTGNGASIGIGLAVAYSSVFGAAGSQSQSVQLEWSGTPTGVFTLWYSNKMHPSLADDTDWIEDTDFAPTNPAGSASKMGDNSTIIPANLKRIKYVHASGAGTLKGWVTVV